MHRHFPVSVFNSSFQRVAIIDDYSYLTWTRRLRRPNDIELRINRYKSDTNYLELGNYLVILKGGKYRIWRIEHKEIELTEDGKGSERWIIKGRSLSGVFDDRLCLNKISDPSSGGYDTQTGTAEALMKHYVNVEVVNPTNTSRAIPNYVIGTNLNRGLSFTTTGRLQSVSDVLETISFTSGLGYLVYYDIITSKFVFDVIEGVDRTVGNGVNPVVMFSPEFGNIKSLQFQHSQLGYKNVAVVGGQGDGKDRVFSTVGTATGLDRRELFVDARDLATGLTQRGQERLAEYNVNLIMEFDHTQTGPFEYEVDFDLGDYVTVIYPEIAQMNTQIIQIDEYVSPENGWTFKLTVGNNIPDLITALKKDRKNIGPEIRR